MPASLTRSPLAGTTFTDPQLDPAWRHVRVSSGGRRELPSSPVALAVDVAGEGRIRDLAAWVADTWSTSLLVVAGGSVVHEWYADGLGLDTRFLGASMSKSVLAHLVGRAVRAGDLGLGDSVADHVPELASSGYAACSVLDAITMTTGVDWVEDHRDPASPASRLLACFAEQEDSRALLSAVRPGARPGTRFAYCTADSQVLDWVRERATGLSYADDVARLWRDLGCTRDAVVAVDGADVALAGGGLAATTRDWARVALLAVDGTVRSQEGSGRVAVLDVGWVEEAARPTYAFLAPGRLPSSITTHAGFGHHWWPMDAVGDRVTADGSRGQFASADRRTGAVVVKTSQWPYDDALVDRQARDLSYLGIHALLDAAGQPPAWTKEQRP